VRPWSMSRWATSSQAYGSFYPASFSELPPRSKVAEPQQALLSALASPRGHVPTQGDGLMMAKARRQAAVPSGTPCDRCDGPHPTAYCPHFSKGRDEHEDARAQNPGGGADAAAGAPTVVRARLVKQPGDGSCMFHSLGHCFGQDPNELRRETCASIEVNPTMEISGTPLSKWIEWDSNLSPAAYAARLRSPGTWGGALELAVVAATLGVVIHVYEPVQADSYKRIATFGSADESEFTTIAHIAYRGRSHYDALVL